MMEEKCETCKSYSKLRYGGEDEQGEHWFCRKDRCVYCMAVRPMCPDYENGPNDGGKHETDEDYED